MINVEVSRLVKKKQTPVSYRAVQEAIAICVIETKHNCKRTQR